MAEIEGQIGERQQRLDRLRGNAGRPGAGGGGYAALATAREAEAELERATGPASSSSRTSSASLERAVDAARRELDLAQGRLGERIRELERRAAERPEHERPIGRGARAAGATWPGARSSAMPPRRSSRRWPRKSAGLKVQNDQLRAEMEA